MFIELRDVKVVPVGRGVAITMTSGRKTAKCSCHNLVWPRKEITESYNPSTKESQFVCPLISSTNT
jgi:hypothetical protein